MRLRVQDPAVEHKSARKPAPLLREEPLVWLFTHRTAFHITFIETRSQKHLAPLLLLPHLLLRGSQPCVFSISAHIKHAMCSVRPRSAQACLIDNSNRREYRRGRWEAGFFFFFFFSFFKGGGVSLKFPPKCAWSCGAAVKTSPLCLRSLTERFPARAEPSRAAAKHTRD